MLLMRSDLKRIQTLSQAQVQAHHEAEQAQLRKEKSALETRLREISQASRFASPSHNKCQTVPTMLQDDN
jgi:hypothetical protein